MSLLETLKSRGLLIWAAAVPLAVCLVYSLLYLASSLGFSLMFFSSGVEQSSVLFRTLNLAVWAVAIFVVLAWLGFSLEFNLIKGYFRWYLSVGLLVAICGMAIGVVSAILGFVGMIALAPISIFILSLCVMFSPDFFDVDRVPLVLRLLVTGLIVGFLVMLTGYLV